MRPIKTFTVYWLYGSMTFHTGFDFEDAFKGFDIDGVYIYADGIDRSYVWLNGQWAHWESMSDESKKQYLVPMPYPLT